jgi:hypothetical protein
MTVEEVSGDEFSSALDAACHLVKQVQTIRDAGCQPPFLKSWKPWIPVANQLDECCRNAAERIKRVLPQIRAATTGRPIVRCGHLAAPTAFDLALELGKHTRKVLNMVDGAAGSH